MTRTLCHNAALIADVKALLAKHDTNGWQAILAVIDADKSIFVPVICATKDQAGGDYTKKQIAKLRRAQLDYSCALYDAVCEPCNDGIKRFL